MPRLRSSTPLEARGRLGEGSATTPPGITHQRAILPHLRPVSVREDEVIEVDEGERIHMVFEGS
jgi:hypothetical protein